MAPAAEEAVKPVPAMTTQQRYGAGVLLSLVVAVDHWRNRRNELARELARQQGKDRSEHRRLLAEAVERERRAVLDLRDAAVYVAGVAGHILEES